MPLSPPPGPSGSRGPLTAALHCRSLSFQWPDGTTVLDGLNLRIGSGRTGLVGLNGSGKTTLLKLLAGELTPVEGSVDVTGSLAHLPQNLTLDTGLRVDAALGIARRRAALHAVEAGDVREEHFETIGEDWDVEERALATLGSLGLGSIGLDRTVGEISGGESVLLRLAALLLRRPDVLLLDEPTNNLDLFARQRLYEAIDSWHSGALVLVSHDRELLEHVDRIAELRDNSVRWYGGGWSAYQEAVAGEQEAAERTLRAAESDERKQRRELVETRTKLARRKRYGQKMEDQKRVPKVAAGARKRAAQESAGKYRILQESRLGDARERRVEAEEAVREDEVIRVDLPHTAVPSARAVLSLRAVGLRHGALRGASLDVHGPERIALVGRNGAGKTSLLRALADELPPLEGEAAVHVPLRFLPQRLDGLDEALSVVRNVRRAAPGASDNQVRARLARFLFKGARADRPVGTLSGGERFRAALAALMLAEPAPQLLLLDEPTNSLDTASVRQLTSALDSYEGALVVASHDVPFLESVGITRWLLLGEDLRETSPEEVRALTGRPVADAEGATRPDGPR